MKETILASILLLLGVSIANWSDIRDAYRAFKVKLDNGDKNTWMLYCALCAGLVAMVCLVTSLIPL